MLIIRVFLAVMGMSHILGVLWFLDDLRGISILSGLLSGLASLIVSLFFRENLEKKISQHAKYTLILFCFIGFVSQIEPIYRYITALKTVQTLPLMLSGLLCVAFVLVIFVIYKNLGREDNNPIK